ncbi:hypothetical protein BBK36DRAFT_23713 [Trichoderma citrinoviride]|uniref:Uncharacterized protein n=1 Tax=Trichoderma citrinoviride TaxID=58853 RepID=A0A2T4AYU7_9HYPO|nr:hypothetical protein BBK36DRAFT_23713 [Trichoderma citrinoviride]PTB62141.1 hypothetical protein BBK36DRAFT_23713 [Trichoderma citrinoviride]
MPQNGIHRAKCLKKDTTSVSMRLRSTYEATLIQHYQYDSYQVIELSKMPSFADLPINRNSTPVPFTVSVSEQQLIEFRTLLKLSKIGPRTYENELTDGRFGISRD